LTWSDIAKLFLILAAVLLFIAAAIGILYYAAQWLGLQAALAWAAFAGVAVLIFRVEVQRVRQHRRVLADRKREQYSELLELLSRCFYSPDPVQAAQRQKQEFDKWSLRLMLLGSDEVLTAWEYFCQVALSGFDLDEEEEDDDEQEEDDEDIEDYGPDDSLFAAHVRLLTALRRDCGHPVAASTGRWLGRILEASE
jgi:hypothetical protein